MTATNRHPPLGLLIFSASLREASFNTRLAALVTRLVEQRGASVDQGSMREFDCPSYDGDREESDGFPAGAEEFRRRLESSDAFIIVSPEYNGSIPGVLKNAIDWASRYHPQPFQDRQALLLSASPSMVGGNRGLWALRTPLEHLSARVYPDMFSLAQAHKAFEASGTLSDPLLEQRLRNTVAGFLDLVEAAREYPCVKAHWYEFLGEHPDHPTTQRSQAATTA